MESNSLLPELLQGTRRRIVLLLRSEERTVRELADALDLTRNAIRAQLAKLQRNGLAERVGRRSTSRKPEHVYGLTEKAEQLFPKSYDEILNALLTVLSEERDGLSPVLRKVGRHLARLHAPSEPEASPRERLDHAKDVLEQMGGLPILEETEDGYRLVGASCPLASVVETHEALACNLVRTMIEELTDLPVEQQCQTDGSCPECTFVVRA